MIETYAVHGPEPTWVLIVSLLAKYVASWIGARLSPLRAAAVTCVITVASTLVGVAAELLLTLVPLYALRGVVLVIVVSLTETLLLGYVFTHGVTVRIAGFVVAANVIWAAASWISLTLPS